MPIYKARFGGQTVPIEADTPEHAALLARVKFANLSSVGRVEDELGAQAAADEQREKVLSRGTSPTQQLAAARLGVAEQMPPEAAALGLGTIGVMAAPTLALGLAKDAAIYGAAEGAEKMLGLPPWMGEAVGLVSPARAAKQLVGRLLTRGGAKAAAGAVAGGAARKVEMTAAEKLAERKLTLEAEKLAEKKAAREASSASRERALKLAEERNALLRSRLEGKAPPKVSAPTPEPAAPTAPAAPPAAAPKPPSSQVRGALGDLTAGPPDEALLLRVQQVYNTGTAVERKAIRDWISQQPTQLQTQFRELLKRGISKPPTVYPGAVKSAGKVPSARERGLGGELARLLGQ